VSRPRILVLSTTTGYQLRAFADAASVLDVELVYASNRCHHLDDPWRDAAIPIRFEDVEGSRRALDVHPSAALLDGVIAIGDQATPLAAELAAARGWPWHAPAGARLSTNKLAARGAWLAAGLPSPWFFALRPDEGLADVAPRLRFPCVIKPLSLSASRGVIKAADPAGFDAAVARARHIVDDATRSARAGVAPDATQCPEATGGPTLLVEGFLPGAEYALEGVMHDGTLRVLAIFEKPEALDGPFFEEHIYVTPPRLDRALQRRGAGMVAHAALATGLRHGPIHAEFRVVGGEIFLLEMAARPIGGLCARALRCLGPGQRSCALEEVLLAQAAGRDLDAYSRAPGASGVAMIPIGEGGHYRGVRGDQAARAIEAIIDVVVTAKRGQLLEPLPEGASYLGFIFAAGETTEAVVEALQRAEAQLSFEFDRPVPVRQSAP
jgi:hypothetical protein